jgi:hypothetical protein
MPLAVYLNPLHLVWTGSYVLSLVSRLILTDCLEHYPALQCAAFDECLRGRSRESINRGGSETAPTSNVQGKG